MKTDAATTVHEATEAGPMPREIEHLLKGHPVTALAPLYPAEPVEAFADRATHALFARYLIEASDWNGPSHGAEEAGCRERPGPLRGSCGGFGLLPAPLSSGIALRPGRDQNGLVGRHGIGPTEA